MLTPAMQQTIESHGLTAVQVNDRTEIRRGTKVISFHPRPGRAAQLALERIEEDRLRNVDKLPSQREPVLKRRRVVALAVAASVVSAVVPVPTPAAGEPAPVAAPSMTDPPKIIKGSIIKSKYKERYKKSGDYSCGDDLSAELRAYLLTTKGGKAHIDVDKLRELAMVNGVWDPKYNGLNVGQQRMNIGNKLRHKFKNGDKIDIGGAIFCDPDLQDDEVKNKVKVA